MIIIGEEKDDDKAFIFTFKNPHGVEPTKFMKKEGSDKAIRCDPDHGPVFCGNDNNNIRINNMCNKSINEINNNGTNGYECHPEYKSSLFVNTAGPDEENRFRVLDYEVYTYN